jgi:RNA polymerase sigma factor (sigma-70 family)
VKERRVLSPQPSGARAPVTTGVDLTTDDWGLATGPALTRVLLDNHSRFLAFLERRVRSRDEAEDILQEAFVRSLERAPPMEDSTSAITWFYRVLRNALTDYYRRRDSRGRAIDRLAAETESATEPDKELEAVVCACVMSLLETLKPEYETALRRVELEGARPGSRRAMRGYGCTGRGRRFGSRWCDAAEPASSMAASTAGVGSESPVHSPQSSVPEILIRDRHFSPRATDA